MSPTDSQSTNSFDFLADIDNRIVTLEQELKTVQTSNPLNENTNRKRPGDKPKPVSGLSLVPNVSTITAKWNPTDIPDLLRYEVQFSTERDFTNAITVPTNITERTLFEGDPGDTYFVRVRAVSKNVGAGPWSSTLNTATGIASASNLAQGASSTVAEYRQTSFTPDDLDTDGESGTYGALRIKTIGQVVRPIIFLKYTYRSEYSGSNTNRITLEVLRDGVQIGEVVPIDSHSTITPAAANALTAEAGFDEPDAGTHEYSIRLTMTIKGSNTLSIVPQVLRMEAVELRR